MSVVILYGPEKSFFDKMWKLADIELTNASTPAEDGGQGRNRTTDTRIFSPGSTPLRTTYP